MIRYQILLVFPFTKFILSSSTLLSLSFQAHIKPTWMTISSLYCPFTVQSSPSDSKLIFSKHWFWFVFYTTTWIEACGLLLRKPQWLPPASWTQCQTPIQELTCPTSLQVPSPWEAGLFCSRDCISLVLVPDFLLSFLCPVFSLSLEERPIAPLHHIASFIEHWESPVLPPNLC